MVEWIIKMMNRWSIDGHWLYDNVEDEYVMGKDKAYVHMFNVIYNQLQEKNNEEDFKKLLSELLDKKIYEADLKCGVQHKKAKVSNTCKDTRHEVSCILDTVFYWQGYLQGLNDLKKELDL